MFIDQLKEIIANLEKSIAHSAANHNGLIGKMTQAHEMLSLMQAVPGPVGIVASEINVGIEALEAGASAAAAAVVPVEAAHASS